MSSIAVYSIVLSGWASGSKYPLLGGVRATAQMISYETAMALSLVPVVLFASAQIAGGSVGVGTMSLSTIVELQAGSFRGPIPGWVVFYHTEYSGVRFALFFLAEYISMFNIAALTVTLFLGGWLGPDFGLPPWIAWAMPTFWFLLKTYALVCVFVWIRASVPRMRYDRLMTFGWKRLIPFSLAWLVLFALLQAVRRFGAPWS
jgi:NADH-quinone oxidoreductase subunit H